LHKKGIMNEKLLIQAEKRIKSSIKRISKGDISLEEANVGSLFNAIKPYDEVLFEKLLVLYVKATKSPFLKK